MTSLSDVAVRVVRNWVTGTIGTSAIDGAGAGVGGGLPGDGRRSPVSREPDDGSVGGAPVSAPGSTTAAGRWARARGPEPELAAGHRDGDRDGEQREDDEGWASDHVGDRTSGRAGKPAAPAAAAYPGRRNAPSGRADGA